MIRADSLRTVTMTASEAATLFLIRYEAVTFAIIKGSEMITK